MDKVIRSVARDAEHLLQFPDCDYVWIAVEYGCASCHVITLSAMCKKDGNTDE